MQGPLALKEMWCYERQADRDVHETSCHRTWLLICTLFTVLVFFYMKSTVFWKYKQIFFSVVLQHCQITSKLQKWLSKHYLLFQLIHTITQIIEF